jgi:transcriptional regulator with XRE-family HTH domain
MNGRLRDLRRLRGLTQFDLAEMAKVSQSLISGYENGTRKATWKSLKPIAVALNVSIVDLFEGTEKDMEPADLLRLYLEKLRKTEINTKKLERITRMIEIILDEHENDPVK